MGLKIKQSNIILAITNYGFDGVNLSEMTLGDLVHHDENVLWVETNEGSRLGLYLKKSSNSINL